MKQYVPNFSLRMNNLTASVIRPQISTIEERVKAYNANYEKLTNILSSVDNIYIPATLENVTRVGDSIQFNLINLTPTKADEFVRGVAERGVKIQIFGSTDNSRYFKTWRYSFESEPKLQQTDSIISFACDLRLPLSLTEDDITLLGDIITNVLYDVIRGKNAP